MVALLRGINVGGKNRLPMQDLRELLTELGCERVSTYIQSGNAVFGSASEAEALSSDIQNSIAASFGFAPQVMVLTASSLDSIIADNPFVDEVADPQLVHVSFLAREAESADIDRMNALCKDSESFHLTSRALYFHAPGGVGRSAFAKSAEKLLGVATTSRNWRTTCKIAEMARRWRME